MNDSTKIFRDYTDEELVEEAMKAVPDFLERIRSTGDFDLEDCVRRGMARVERLFKVKHGIRAFFQLDNRERAEWIQAQDRIRPVLTERMREIQLRYLRSRKVSQLNSVTAKVLIEGTFKAAGLDVVVTGQRYRARVEVPMPPGHVVRFYIGYKKLLKEDGILEETLDAVRKLMEALGKLGYGAAVKRI
jgi:hypothetical protein